MGKRVKLLEYIASRMMSFSSLCRRKLFVCLIVVCFLLAHMLFHINIFHFPVYLSVYDMIIFINKTELAWRELLVPISKLRLGSLGDESSD